METCDRAARQHLLLVPRASFGCETAAAAAKFLHWICSAGKHESMRVSLSGMRHRGVSARTGRHGVEVDVSNGARCQQEKEGTEPCLPPRACVAQVRAFVCGDASGTACKLIPALTVRALETNNAQILWCSA